MTSESSLPNGPHGDSEWTLAIPGRDEPHERPGNGTEAASGKENDHKILADRQVGEFQLLRLLGRGGMAEVYLALQTSLKRHVAVKILQEELLTDDVYLKRFEQEAKATAGLNHPNIVQVYAVGSEGGIHYIAQEYVQGQNLREFLNRQGPPGAAVALHLMKQVAAALQAAAEAGIVHRDIKPENILITRKGVVKVADFGLAQLTQGGERLNLTQVGTTMGTPLYMSPEQVNGEQLDQRSDIYSFGVTCYHMLAGRPPFRGETAIQVAVQHLNEEAEPLHVRRPDLPKSLCDIVHKMMAKDRGRRYPDAKSVLKDLDRVARSTRSFATEETLIEQFETGQIGDRRRGWRVPAWLTAGPRRQQIVLFLAACLLVGFGSAAVGWVMRPGNPLEAPLRAVPADLQKETVEEQYALAMQLEYDEEAWRAVIENFPDERFYKRRAQEQLAMLYLLRNEQFDEAEAIFNEFALLEHEDPALEAQGLAGKALIATRRRDFRTSQRIIANELRPLRSHLDPRMERLIREAIGQNQRALGEEIDKRFEEFFSPDPLD